MGIVASNYIVEDKIIDQLTKADFDFYDYFEKELMYHEYKNSYFEKNGILFGALVKAWSPMYELIKILDSSDKKVLSKIGSNTNYIPEKGKNDSMYFYYSYDVKKIWKELKNISVGQIEKSLNDSEIIKKVSKIQGYWNDRIDRKEHIIMEFFELHSAFYNAHLKNKGIVIVLG